jgi:glucose-6-phosphate dehydrogenase assembly protein OpcA
VEDAVIRDLTDTTTTGISKTLVRLRNEVGALALGRVLTLVVVVEDTDAGNAIEVANQASRQHPCRIVVVIAGDRRGKNRLDAQIRLGGDAGASEIVVLRLYGALANHGPSVVVPLLLPDSPIVAWWPGEAPADVGKDPIGAMAQRRITDVAEHRNPRLMLKKRAASYAPGDTDLAWTRITRWRGLLAAALDQPPYEPITGAVVSGAPDSPSSDLLAAWLSRRLHVPVHRVSTPRGSGIGSVRLERKSGPIDLVRPGDVVATLSQTGQPDRRISLPRRELPECLADELRRLDPDDAYEDALLHGLGALQPVRLTAAAAAKAGKAPDPAESRRRAPPQGPGE